MLDFSLTEEQEEIRRLAHMLAVEQLRPQGRSAEKSGDIAPALMQTLAQTGLTTPFPEIYGGSGDLKAITYVVIAEELGFGDGGLALNIIGSMMGPLTVALAGDEQQKNAYIPPFCDSRKGADERGSLAFAERSGGYAVGDISATVRFDGEQYIINGTKRDVVHGNRSRPRVVLLRQEHTTGDEGIGAFLLPADLTGLEIIPDTHKLGLLAAPTVSYIFHDVRLPASMCLGGPGEAGKAGKAGKAGSDGALRAAALYALLRGGIACGMAQAALEYAGGYAKERIAFGRPIVSYQGIAFMLAEMAMKLDAARLLLWHAAVNWDHAVDSARTIHDAEAAQYQALNIAKSATTDAIQIMGGAGFIQDHPVEMWMRNAAAME
ncbi:MAG: acyl-CoA dehydrogenase family protein [Ktedonobacteraceae bacterium]|nr:acyl-CoA dehydrogenase family protein [Ktedonobacteraceae bacterium]